MLERQNVGDTLTWVPISTNGHFFNCIPGTVTLVVTPPLQSPPPILRTEENTRGLKTIISAFPLDSYRSLEKKQGLTHELYKG